MGKPKTLKKPKGSSRSTQNREVVLREGVKTRKYRPYRKLGDEKFVAQAIWECLCNNEPEEIVEIIQGHLLAVNKSEACHKGGIPRSTLYHMLRSKNPTLKTLARVVSSSVE